jgi:KaiC/GvpD/RAD55 family RecA-like ATPase
MYDLSDVLAVDALGAVAPGTTMLVSGPAMTGTADIARAILASGASAGDGAVAVTTSGTAAEEIAALRERGDDPDPNRLAAIDCRGDADSRSEETPEGSLLYHVGDPGDLTGMGIGITQSFERFEDYGLDRVRLGLSSLSTMLTYTDQQTVFKFCHVLSSRIDTADYLGAFTIDSSAHDEQTLQVVKQPFDGMIEVREQDGTREARVMGLQPDPSDWVRL